MRQEPKSTSNHCSYLDPNFRQSKHERQCHMRDSSFSLKDITEKECNYGDVRAGLKRTNEKRKDRGNAETPGARISQSFDENKMFAYC